MTKERPILFSSPMVKALLDGKKTQTRRVVKPQPPHGLTDHYGTWAHATPEGACTCRVQHCPYGAPGDTLWVRETWAAAYDSDGDMMTSDVVYRASSPDHQPYHRAGPFETWEVAGYSGWRPSIFMPRWASRLTLRITEVRVERVQDISEDDARAEGVRLPERTVTLYNGIYAAAYAALWDSINAKRGYGWDVNPWVWVLSFEVLP